MDRPVALKLISSDADYQVHRVSIDPSLGADLKAPRTQDGPAVIVVSGAAILSEMSAGVLDIADVQALVQGDWNDAVLVVLPKKRVRVESVATHPSGDAQFLADAKRRAKGPELADLAAKTLSAIRAVGVDGNLVDQGNGRWVNRPVNTFTLKVQPSAGNIQFTLYGNPDTYKAGIFLKKDQNSYSRGWVRTDKDVQRLAELAKESHLRRPG